MADLNSELFKQLGQFAFAPSKTNDMDIAKQILANSVVDFSKTWDVFNAGQVTPTEKPKPGKSTFAKVIDIISRPMYAVWESEKQAHKDYDRAGKLAYNEWAAKHGKPTTEVPDEEDTNALKGAWEGFSGQKKTRPSELFKEQGKLPKNKAGAFAVGLTADILGDPLTYVGPGLIRGIGKGIKGLTDLSKTKAVMEASEVVSKPNKIESLYGGAVSLGNEPTNSVVLKAIDDAPSVSTALEQTTRNAAATEASGLSAMQQAAVNSANITEAKGVLKALDLSPAAQKTFGELSEGVMYRSRGTVQNTLTNHSDVITARIRPKGARGPNGKFIPTKAKTWPKVVQSTTHALNQALDEPIRVLKPGETVSEKGVIHGIMSRIATWWGQKDIRPLVLDAKTSALASTEARIRAVETLFKGYTQDEILEAWDVATKIRPNTLSNDKVIALSDQLTGAMETILRSSSVASKNATGNSVALRAGVTLQDFNKALKRYGVPVRLTNGSNVPVKGGQVTRDFSNDVDWLDSWEGLSFKTVGELKSSIFGMQSAVEQVTREYAFLDDLASRFGSTQKQRGWVQVKNDRLDGFYFPPELGDQISLALKTYYDMYRPGSPVSKVIASATSAWKSGVTKYHPRHHIANVIGDSFLAFIAGVTNPAVFTKSMQVLMSQRNLYSDLAGVENLVGPGAIANAMTKPGKVITKNRSGMPFTADQLYIAAHNYGLLQRVSAIEDIVRPGLGKMEKYSPFQGKVSKAASTLSESREHYVKMAHFIDAVSKSKGSNLKEVFENAAHEVRKWHPDGLDLTKEEQALRSLGVPFYSWLRKSTPLLIEGAVMRPGRTLATPHKLNYHAQVAGGVQPSEYSDPFSVNQAFPKWIQSSGIGPMGMSNQKGLLGWLAREGVDENGKPIPGYAVAGPSLPTNDLFEQMGGFSPGGIARGLMGSINPMLRIPVETTLNQRAFSGVPILDKTDYITEQIPIVAQGARMTNMTPFGPSSRHEKEGFGNKEATANWLLNAGIIGTGPYIANADFEMIPQQKEQNKKFREFANEIGYPLNSKGKIPQWIKDLYTQQRGGK